MNTPMVGVRVPESLQAAAREATGQQDISVVVRAGLQLLIECPPERARQLLDAHRMKTGRKSNKESN